MILLLASSVGAQQVGAQQSYCTFSPCPGQSIPTKPNALLGTTKTGQVEFFPTNSFGACAFSPCKPSVEVTPNGVLQSDSNGDLSFVNNPQSGLNPLTFGATCGGGDSTAGIQSAVNAASTSAGLVVISCPMTVAGQVTIPDNVRLMGVGPVYYRGMLDTSPAGAAVAPTWPPAVGSAINCTSISTSCFVVAGIGVEIDHINFGNPQPVPPSSGVNNYIPTVYPYIIGTSAASNWNGLNLHNLTFTSASKCIDLEGSPNYNTSGIAGAQWTISDIWMNPCMNIGIRFAQIDNTGRVSNVDMDWWWYRNNQAVGYYMENNSVGFDMCYNANAEFNNIEFLYNKTAIQFENCTVVGGFGHTGAADNLQFNNISFNLPCQAVSIPNGNGTHVSAIFTNVLAFADNSWCNGATTYQTGYAPIFFDFSSDNINVKMVGVRGGAVQTFAAIGHGADGNLEIGDLNIQAYSAFAAGAPAFKIAANSHFSLYASDFSAIVPSAGAGALEGPGVGGTQGYMVAASIGGGTNALEGGVTNNGSGNTTHSGYTAFWYPNGVQAGWIGHGVQSDRSVEIMSLNGAVNFVPNNSGKVLINVNGLPTSCSGLPTGTLWDNANVIQSCP